MDYRGVDYYGIEALLTEEQRMVRDAVRDWVEKEFVPIVAEHHRAGTFPMEVAKPLGEMGVFGATLKGYGCAGLDNVAYGLIMQELERIAPTSLSHRAVVPNKQCGQTGIGFLRLCSARTCCQER